jgi:AT-rich interactive domain-containing protein 2
MAKILDKNAATYPKERDGFLRDLHHFHETRGTPFRRPPILAGKEVDLYLLYTLVTGQGGWIKVNSKNGWSDVLDQLRLPKDCVNGSVALKQIYLR